MVMVMVMTMMMLMMVLAKTTHTGWLVLIWRNQSSFTPPSHTFMSQLKQCNTPQNTLQCPELHSILHSCITTHHSALDFVVSRPIRHSTGAAQFCMIFGCADISQNLCNLLLLLLLLFLLTTFVCRGRSDIPTPGNRLWPGGGSPSLPPDPHNTLPDYTRRQSTPLKGHIASTSVSYIVESTM